jgi:hypothetical protein
MLRGHFRPPSEAGSRLRATGSERLRWVCSRSCSATYVIKRHDRPMPREGADCSGGPVVTCRSLALPGCDDWPIQQNRDRRRRRSAHEHIENKPSTIPGNVVIPFACVTRVCFEQWPWNFSEERWCRADRHRHEFSIRRDVEELFAIATPSRRDSNCRHAFGGVFARYLDCRSDTRQFTGHR